MATATTTATHARGHPSPRCASCPPEPTSFDWALSVLAQPTPPTVREILTAYSKNGREDRELLLSLLAAKTAEDNRIAHQLALHRSLLHLQYNLPLSPPPEPSSFPALPSHSHSHSHLREEYKPLDRPYGPSYAPGPAAHSNAHDTYPSPTTSSPPGLGSRSPPSASTLGKRARSPPPAASYAYAREHEQRTPPSRASPISISLRGLLSDPDPDPDPDPSHSRDDYPSRAAKRRAVDILPQEQGGLGMGLGAGGGRELTYQRAPESSVRLSPGMRVLLPGWHHGLLAHDQWMCAWE
ncbi:hypothetical protein CALCODRAFT_506337 [Calocera cornea HHB12733]|uniref:Uncharacterized protein n=1 Tax=Calocera cornea HHB12733 TaxID=1353952 RepID=A0A165J460_9BASI|nr:hypothetical protein CALCODRAFT_506337 [Calocera cornea HHB12733]